MCSGIPLLARLHFVLQAAAALCVATVLRPGLPGAPRAERVVWLAEMPTAWVLGWGPVVFAPFVVLGFFLYWGRTRRGAASRRALGVAVVGGVLDLGSAVLAVGLLPVVARVEPERFAGLERVVVLAQLAGARPCYAAAVALAAAGEAAAARGVAALVVASTLVLAVGACSGRTDVVAWAVGPALVAFGAWPWAAARALGPPDSRERLRFGPLGRLRRPSAS